MTTISGPTAETNDGSPVVAGDTIRDFRGQDWTFVRVSMPPGGNSSGRVLVTDEFNRKREFYPSVFDLTIVTYELCPRGCGYSARANSDRAWKQHFEFCPVQYEPEFDAE